MIGHINIYGEIANVQSSDAGDWGLVSLKSVVDSINSQPNATEFQVHIHSNGGDVSEGLAIYDVLKATGKKITTVNDGVCYSIASVIFCAGDVRITNPNSSFVIHNELGYVEGSAEDLRKAADAYEEARSKIVNIYKNTFNIEEEQIRGIMEEDKIMNVNEAKTIGLVTEISEPLKAVAYFKITNVKHKAKKMSNQKEMSLLNKIKNLLNGKEIKNLVVKTADQSELDFVDLVEGDVPKIGDKAEFDGNPAVGEFVMPDGNTYVFVDGVLDTVIEKAEDPQPNAKLEELTNQFYELKSKFENVQADLQNKKKELKKANATLEGLKNIVSKEIIETKTNQVKGPQERQTTEMGSIINNL